MARHIAVDLLSKLILGESEIEINSGRKKIGFNLTPSEPLVAQLSLNPFGQALLEFKGIFLGKIQYILCYFKDSNIVANFPPIATLVETIYSYYRGKRHEFQVWIEVWNWFLHFLWNWTKETKGNNS